MRRMWEPIRLVVTVMAYPAISQRHGEAVCVAGIRTDQIMQASWVRLFPLKVRDLPRDLRVGKWDEVDLRVAKPASDRRPESFTPDHDSIEIVGSLSTAGAWSARRGLVDLLPRYATMTEVMADRQATGVSLAAVDPGEILDFLVIPKPPAEVEELQKRADAEAAQGDLFSLEDKKPLEPIPYDFYYLVRYQDETEPRRLKLIDWEVNQAWRKWRHAYPDVEDRIKDKWLNVVAGADRDPLFFVGNQHRFPDQFLLLSVFWPPRT